MTIKIIVKKDSNGSPRKSAKGETTIYVRYQHNSKIADFQACKVSTQSLELIQRSGRLEINEPYIKQRAKGRLEAIETIELVKMGVKTAANKLMQRAIDPTPKRVKEEYESGFEKNVETHEKARLVDVFNDYIQSQKTAGMANGTLKQYNTTLNHIRAFHTSEGIKFTIDQVDLNYYDAFVSYLKITHKGIKKDSTVGKNIKTLKAMLRWARSRGHTVHNDIEDKNFRVSKSKKKIVYLTEEEVDALRAFDLSKNPKLKKVRDRFVFNCYVGLRVGDLNKLSQRHIKTIHRNNLDVSVIDIITEKQKKQAIIPLKPIPLSILRNYDFQLPSISDQKFNQYLKELLGLAEIKREIEIEPGVFQSIDTLVASHVAIKTFITLCHKWRIPTKHVALITGKTEKVINEYYYAVNEEDLIDAMIFND